MNLQILETIQNLEYWEIIAISVTITVILFIINLAINNIFYDFLCVLSFSTSASFIYTISSDIEFFTREFYMFNTIFFIVAIVVYILFFRYLAQYSETSNTISDKTTEGKVAKVIVPIPKDGVGEVVVISNFQRISLPAQSYEQGVSIDSDKDVLLIEKIEGVWLVKEYKSFFNH